MGAIPSAEPCLHCAVLDGELLFVQKATPAYLHHFRRAKVGAQNFDQRAFQAKPIRIFRFHTNYLASRSHVYSLHGPDPLYLRRIIPPSPRTDVRTRRHLIFEQRPTLRREQPQKLDSRAFLPPHQPYKPLRRLIPTSGSPARPCTLRSGASLQKPSKA